MSVEFATLTPAERIWMDAIIDRAKKELSDVDPLSLEMDLSAVHATVPLDLERLKNFPSFDFAHDIYGIRNCLDRGTGKLERRFSPRCTKRDFT